MLASFMNALPGAVTQGMIWGIIAIGVYITYKILDIADLTVDGTVCTGGATFVILMTGGYSLWFCLAMSFIAGMLAGLITGILHTFMGIPALLAGILTQLALFSINLTAIMDGKANVAINVLKYDLFISRLEIEGVPFLENSIFKLTVLVVILIIILYWFFGTELGCALRATGSNQNMSRAQGINTKFNVVLGLMLSNGIVALGGALLAQYQGSADVNMGRGAIVIGLAAVIIGEVIFNKIFHNFGFKLLGVVFGGIIYYVVITGVIMLGVNTNYSKMLTAFVVAIFLAMPYWKKNLRYNPTYKKIQENFRKGAK